MDSPSRAYRAGLALGALLRTHPGACFGAGAAFLVAALVVAGVVGNVVATEVVSWIQ